MTQYYKLESGNIAIKRGPGDYGYASSGGWVKSPSLMGKIDIDGDAEEITATQAKSALKKLYPGIKFFQ